MQRPRGNGPNILNNQVVDSESHDTDFVELGHLRSSHYEVQRRTPKNYMTNVHLTDPDTEAEEDELLLSPGNRRKR